MSAPLGMLSLPTAIALRPSPQRRAVLSRRIRWFVAATITYNVIEAIIALSEGARVSSTALIGFGLDSVIEVSSAAAVAWQFAGPDPERREDRAADHRLLLLRPGRLRRRGLGAWPARNRGSQALNDRNRAGCSEFGSDAGAVVRAAPRRT